jgi:cell division septation protein DedD
MEDSPRSSKAPQLSARAVQPEAATAAGAPESPASVQARRASNAPVAPQPAHTYGIDLGAYSDLSRANQLIDRFQGLGLTPEGSKYYIIVAPKNGAFIYLVQLLNLESRDAADHLCSQLHDLKLDCKVQ